MSTAVAAPPAVTTTTTTTTPFAAMPPSSTSVLSAPPSAEPPAAKRARSNGSPAGVEITASAERSASSGKASPNALRNGAPPMVKVKREPGSPSLQSSRPRPKRLDLSSSMANNRGPQSSRPSAPLTSRDSAGLAIHDVGLACLSPGFQTHDPAMREQLQRSLDVRDQQRQIIEARQKGQKPSSSHENTTSGAGDPSSRPENSNFFGMNMRTPTTSRRKGPPPGLTISAPSAAQFANDRVIQSAPMHQTFTGLAPGEHPFTRHAQHGPSALSQTSHIHHVPATQTNNRLPPIADVFAINDRLEAPRNYSGQSPSSHHNNGSNSSNNNNNAHMPPPLPSPSFPPPSFQQQSQQQQSQQNQNGSLSSARSREYRSAEEAVQGLSGGREDLMPKVVHYGGVQPPTPPSPMPPHGGHQQQHHQQHHQQYYSHQAHLSYQPAAAPHQHQAPPLSQQQLHHGSGNGSGSGSGSGNDVPSSRPDILARTSSLNGSRRRGREEYERDNGSSPLSQSRHVLVGDGAKRTAFAFAPPRGERERERGWGGEGMGEREREREREEGGEDWMAGMSGGEKREEFLRLCARAWDLMHS
ncbi:hypothetical protein BAUCODRAFT_465988 [Baudoinia panamericana UAMH 10762]|uniref:Uncharacterized protein n=1 Tax=Baudoinia panamericana (strain UAMH 10762) TaxID=717646 RepID=M2MHT1_BAUPA|nr:uncharacterized protein BAUCODRAFT_465988 [Baudoinia panamericana UAMH 10762]EMC96186.1 hypothetical protein BAUCODRAFT_465988 [Baudoinia panamericana UAMH 10762]